MNTPAAKTIWCCPECGSTNVQSPEWCKFDVATQRWISAGGDTAGDEFWCEHCQTHHKRLDERAATTAELEGNTAQRVAFQDGGQFYDLESGKVLSDYGDTGSSAKASACRVTFLAANPEYRMATDNEAFG